MMSESNKQQAVNKLTEIVANFIRHDFYPNA